MLKSTSINKAWNNFSFICRKHYISKLLAEVSPDKKKSTSTYSQAQKFKEKITKSDVKYCEKCELKITEQDKTLSIMYCSPKMYQTPIGARFIIAPKNCRLQY